MSYLFIILFIFSNAFAAKREGLSVCTLKLAGGMVDDRNHGFIVELLKKTLADKYKLKIVVLPIQRSMKTFRDKGCDLFATAMAGDLNGTELPTGLQDYYSIFSLNKNLIKKHYDKHGLKSARKSQNGLKLIEVRSWNAPKRLLAKNTVYKTQNMPMAIKMLQAKRADFLIGFNFLVRSYIKKEKIENIAYFDDLRYAGKQVVFVLRAPNAKMIQKDYKKKMFEIIKSGLYERLIRKYKTPPWLLLRKDKLLNSLENI